MNCRRSASEFSGFTCSIPPFGWVQSHGHLYLKVSGAENCCIYIYIYDVAQTKSWKIWIGSGSHLGSSSICSRTIHYLIRSPHAHIATAAINYKKTSTWSTTEAREPAWSKGRERWATEHQSTCPRMSDPLGVTRLPETFHNQHHPSRAFLELFCGDVSSVQSTCGQNRVKPK